MRPQVAPGLPWGRHLFLWAVLVLNLSTVGSAGAADRITVQLNWKATGGFSHYYLAADEGFFAENRLDVTFLHADHRTDTIARIVKDEAQVGLTTGNELIRARMQGVPVRAIAAIYQRSPFVFLALPETGITTPRQFVGKRIRVTQDILPTLRAVMAFLGYGPDSYQIVKLPSDVDRVLAGDVPVWGAYVSGLVTRLRLRGVEPNLIFPDDYGVVSYAHLIVTTDDYIAGHRDLLARFLHATLRGILTVLQAPDRIGPSLLRRDPSLDVAVAVQEVIATTPLIITGEAPIGWLEPRIWNYMVEVLVEGGLLTAPLPAADLMDLGPLEAAHARLGR